MKRPSPDSTVPAGPATLGHVKESTSSYTKFTFQNHLAFMGGEFLLLMRGLAGTLEVFGLVPVGKIAQLDGRK